jgi:hypothetical protein
MFADANATVLSLATASVMIQIRIRWRHEPRAEAVAHNLQVEIMPRQGSIFLAWI